MTQGSHFQVLLRAAADQAEPQRLLFVFAGAELPDRPTPAQRERFLTGNAVRAGLVGQFAAYNGRGKPIQVR